jgi:hypothetical protein
LTGSEFDKHDIGMAIFCALAAYDGVGKFATMPDLPGNATRTTCRDQHAVKAVEAMNCLKNRPLVLGRDPALAAAVTTQTLPN